MCNGEPFGGIFASRRPIQSKKARERNRTLLENEFTEAQNRAQVYLDKTKPESSSESSRDSVREGREEEIRIQSPLDSQAFPSLRLEENIPIEPRLDSQALSSLQHEDKIRIHPHLYDRDLHHPNNWRQTPLMGVSSN